MLFCSGVWNVPFVSQAYLINGTLLKGNAENEVFPGFVPSYKHKDYPDLDPDMTFCSLVRDAGIFMFVTNLENYGHLVNPDTFDTSRKHPDMYEIYSNQKDWQQKYIHENYSKILEDDFKIEEPCPDVYWFPAVSPQFCTHLIEIMENFGKWSDGKNYVSCN